MPLWNGETWTCAECDSANAVLRERCRICRTKRVHPDPQIQTEIAADCREARKRDEEAFGR
jgi:hypothetical protein